MRVIIADIAPSIYASRSVAGERSAMGEDVSDGLLIDVRGLDLGELLTERRAAGMETALDRLLESTDNICYSFPNYI
jgi:hypothetical protein